MLVTTFSAPNESFLFAGGCVLDPARSGVLSSSLSGKTRLPVVCGRLVDIRLGEPILVCLGVEARAGGSLGVLRRCSVWSTSGAELFWIFMSLLVRVRSPLRRGEGIGEEKMPEIGSMPCSSRTPLSGSVMPVFLHFY